MHPMHALAYAQNGAGASPMGDLLQDFGDLMETEWRLLVAAMFLALSFVWLICTTLLAWMHPFMEQPAWWTYSAYASGLTFIGTLVYLVEPRPMVSTQNLSPTVSHEPLRCRTAVRSSPRVARAQHWLPSLGRMRQVTSN